MDGLTELDFINPLLQQSKSPSAFRCWLVQVKQALLILPDTSHKK